ncbi:MAG: hypothetical protein JW983_02670 [Elusimicrobia bacterium]|nr:hypothetical protein [Elusimicrobiota bacterium]
MKIIKIFEKSNHKPLLFTFYFLVLTCLSACASLPKKISEPKKTINVGFDIDDTLLFSTPAVLKILESGAPEYSEEWWVAINNSDEGNSVIKKVTEKILNEHKTKGNEIFAITARRNSGGDGLRKFLNKTFGIKKENIYFTERKSEKIRELNIKIFYGDSDTDIKAAQDAGIEGLRILRSPKSSYKINYNPGRYGEKIIPNSEE